MHWTIAPRTFQGKVKTYKLKIRRYPGTFTQFKALSDLGLFDQAPIKIGSVELAPRQIFCSLFEPRALAEATADVCLMRAQVSGLKDGRQVTAVVELVDYHDPATGFPRWSDHGVACRDRGRNAGSRQDTDWLVAA